MALPDISEFVDVPLQQVVESLKEALFDADVKEAMKYLDVVYAKLGYERVIFTN